MATITTINAPVIQTAVPQNSPLSAPVPGRMLVKWYIGIDPGRNTGIALYEEGKIKQLRSGSHCEMLLYLQALSQTEGIILEAVLEDVHADKTNFVASKFIAGMMKSAVLKKKIPNEKARLSYAINAACKRSRDSGMAAGFAADWQEFLSLHQIPYATLAPSKRDNAETLLAKAGRVLNHAGVIRSLTAPTKLSAAQFRELTGYTGSTNEHTRDAGTLVWWYAKGQEKIQAN